MIRIFPLLLVALLSAVVGAPAPGQEATRRTAQGPLARADKNGDGKVSFDEALGLMPKLTRENFKRLDANGDGFVTSDDRIVSRRQKLMTPWVNRLFDADADRDGKVTFAELQNIFPEVTEGAFARVDRDGDGSITAIERTGAIPLSRRSSEERIERTIKGWDRDGDGYVTFEELTVAQPNYSRAAFNRMDRDHNGKISKEDFAANRLRRPNSETILPGAEPGRESVLLRVEFIEDLMQGDANGDGSVSFEEAKKRAPKLTRQTFARLDRNKDGVLDSKDRGQLKRRGGQLRQPKTAPSKSNRPAGQGPVRLPRRPPSPPKR